MMVAPTPGSDDVRYSDVASAVGLQKSGQILTSWPPIRVPTGTLRYRDCLHNRIA